MSDQDKPSDGNLVPVGRSELVRIASTNPLVSRGIADLAKIQDLPDAVSPPDPLMKLRSLVQRHQLVSQKLTNLRAFAAKFPQAVRLKLHLEDLPSTHINRVPGQPKPQVEPRALAKQPEESKDIPMPQEQRDEDR